MRLSKLKHLIPAPANAVSYELVPSVSVISADSDGNVTTGNISVSAYRIEDGTRTSCALIYHEADSEYYFVQYSIDNGTWTNCSNVRITEGSSYYISYGVPASVVANVTESIRFRLCYGTSSSYSVLLLGSALPVVKDGAPGDPGATGPRSPWYYYDGEFDSTKEYTGNSSKAPWVSIEVTVNGSKVVYGYMLVANTNLVDGNYIAPATSEASGIWEFMTSDFKWIITEAVFASFAKLGSWVFKGDYMITQQGEDSDFPGEVSTGYQNFDPSDLSVWIPRIMLNARNGSGHLAGGNLSWDSGGNVNMKGTLTCKNMSSVFADLSDAYIKYDDETVMPISQFEVGVDTLISDENGNETDISGIWNFTATACTFVLPVNQNVIIGQRVIIYSNELGIGGTSNLCRIVAASTNNGAITSYSDLRGVGINKTNASLPVPLNDYYPVKEIDFCNGCVELMAVPSDTYDCEWCVVNIGTNIYRLYETPN